MSHPQKKRSHLTIDAVMQAAATGHTSEPNPPRKLAAIAGLAGFVLRLFRTKESLPTADRGIPPARRRGRPCKGISKMQQGSSQPVRTQNTAKAAPLTNDSRVPLTANQGGINHG